MSLVRESRDTRWGDDCLPRTEPAVHKGWSIIGANAGGGALRRPGAPPRGTAPGRRVTPSMGSPQSSDVSVRDAAPACTRARSEPIAGPQPVGLPPDTPPAGFTGRRICVTSAGARVSRRPQSARSAPVLDRTDVQQVGGILVDFSQFTDRDDAELPAGWRCDSVGNPHLSGCFPRAPMRSTRSSPLRDRRSPDESRGMVRVSGLSDPYRSDAGARPD